MTPTVENLAEDLIRAAAKTGVTRWKFTAARQSIQGAPWPLCGELFRITPAGIETGVTEGVEAEQLGE